MLSSSSSTSLLLLRSCSRRGLLLAQCPRSLGRAAWFSSSAAGAPLQTSKTTFTTRNTDDNFMSDDEWYARWREVEETKKKRTTTTMTTDVQGTDHKFPERDYVRRGRMQFKVARKRDANESETQRLPPSAYLTDAQVDHELRTVFVRSLPEDITEEEAKEVIEKYAGPVEKIEFVRDLRKESLYAERLLAMIEAKERRVKQSALADLKARASASKRATTPVRWSSKHSDKVQLVKPDDTLVQSISDRVSNLASLANLQMNTAIDLCAWFERNWNLVRYVKWSGPFRGLPFPPERYTRDQLITRLLDTENELRLALTSLKYLESLISAKRKRGVYKGALPKESSSELNSSPESLSDPSVPFTSPEEVDELVLHNLDDVVSKLALLTQLVEEGIKRRVVACSTPASSHSPIPTRDEEGRSVDDDDKTTGGKEKIGDNSMEALLEAASHDYFERKPLGEDGAKKSLLSPYFKYRSAKEKILHRVITAAADDSLQEISRAARNAQSVYRKRAWRRAREALEGRTKGALVTFASEEGAHLMLDPMIRTFGMIIDKSVLAEERRRKALVDARTRRATAAATATSSSKTSSENKLEEEDEALEKDLDEIVAETRTGRRAYVPYKSSRSQQVTLHACAAAEMRTLVLGTTRGLVLASGPEVANALEIYLTEAGVLDSNVWELRSASALHGDNRPSGSEGSARSRPEAVVCGGRVLLRFETHTEAAVALAKIRAADAVGENKKENPYTFVPFGWRWG